MTFRNVTVIAGLIVGIAAFIAVSLNWTACLLALHIDPAVVAASAGSPMIRLSWAVSAAFAAFAIATMAVASVGGIAETTRTRTRIETLRHDPAFVDRWNAADWRAAFSHTAIAGHAEAMIALVPVDGQENRRVVVDTPLLLALNRIWLDRMTLTWTIAPLPAILLAFTVTLALFVHGAGEKWEAALAAGMAGWFVIRVSQYLARAALAPLADAAVEAATAVIRPLSSAAVNALPAIPAGQPAAGAPKRIEQEEAEIIAAALSNVIWEPLRRLADAAEKLSVAAQPPSRDQAIEAALAEVRAGIEKLLAGSEPD